MNVHPIFKYGQMKTAPKSQNTKIQFVDLSTPCQLKKHRRRDLSRIVVNSVSSLEIRLLRLNSLI